MKPARTSTHELRKVIAAMPQRFTLCIIILLSAAAVSAQTGPRSEHSSEGSQDAAQSCEAAPQKDAGLESHGPMNHHGASPERHDARIVRLGPPTTYLKEGLTKREVLKLLGRPADISERREGDKVVTSYVFRRGARRILVAEFVNDLLVRSRTEVR